MQAVKSECDMEEEVEMDEGGTDKEEEEAAWSAGDLCDAKDQYDQWCKCKVVAVTKWVGIQAREN